MPTHDIPAEVRRGSSAGRLRFTYESVYLSDLKVPEGFKIVVSDVVPSNSFAHSLINPENYSQWLTSKDVSSEGERYTFKVDAEEVNRTSVLDLTKQQFDAEGDKVARCPFYNDLLY